MIRITCLIWLISLAGLYPLALPAQSNTLYSTRKGVISIKSDAPLELIEASSDGLKGVIDITKRTFSFSIQNRSFKGFNSPLQQEHFYENYIEANKYPVSTFKGKIIEQVDLTVDGSYQVRAKGLLNIHGAEQERIIRIDLMVRQGVIHANSLFMVPLTDHNITIPKIVYQKIAGEIGVTVNAVFTPETK
ncbi:MAG: YceI family protein [Bacteroidota bacterium]